MHQMYRRYYFYIYTHLKVKFKWKTMVWKLLTERLKMEKRNRFFETIKYTNIFNT